MKHMEVKLTPREISQNIRDEMYEVEAMLNRAGIKDEDYDMAMQIAKNIVLFAFLSEKDDLRRMRTENDLLLTICQKHGIVYEYSDVKEWLTMLMEGE